MAHPALIAALEEGSEPERWEAAKQLTDLADLADTRRLIRLLRRGRTSRARESAAWILGSVWLAGPGLVEALLEALQDTRESPLVRAQAAEALGDRFDRGALPRRQLSRVGRALTVVLEHPDPELRFWAAFSLGKLRFRPALDALRAVASSDTRFCPGWWRVCDEARDAIRWIETGKPPKERSRVGETLRRLAAGRPPRERARMPVLSLRPHS
ncbi:MAG: HEAT repeat domain-containing protein [Myxococcaceae bacterium]